MSEFALILILIDSHWLTTQSTRMLTQLPSLHFTTCESAPVSVYRVAVATLLAYVHKYCYGRCGREVDEQEHPPWSSRVISPAARQNLQKNRCRNCHSLEAGSLFRLVIWQRETVELAGQQIVLRQWPHKGL